MTAPTQQRNPWVMLALFLGLVSVVALVGSLSTMAAPEVYSQFEAPSWALPGAWFGPLWTVSYVVLALAGWAYWRTDGETQGFALYGIGLLFNLLWAPLFFAGGSVRLACVDIVLLDFFVIMTVGLFYRRSRTAALLLLLYFGWLCYTTALNIAIIALNDVR
ncbi:TspO/MBR related protein [Amycolatopsis sulphurea]|uniref:TspO/MBR related protein n=1 Tax=Amycolatopsis sulphurea TaxID=76022 RepID=A0A2A9FA05_9PSEU|nr:TspO/MBR family protein [Amycolatopsis sulphurea]PFG47783.1 TspO/MBR related protein [Amycolatopsis sulphurea]